MNNLNLEGAVSADILIGSNISRMPNVFSLSNSLMLDDLWRFFKTICQQGPGNLPTIPLTRISHHLR